MEISLAGRAAVITGGSKGVGLAVARRFAASGADVTIMARGRAALDRAIETIRVTARGRVAAVQGDVAAAADLQRLHDDAVASFGKIDILVNNAGTSRSAPFDQLTEDMWREDFDEKLFAAIRLTRLVWPQMKERRWGRIINVLNVGAKAPRPASAPTSVTRAAGMALTKVLAGEGGPHNVLVNALLIGIIEADQHARTAARLGIELQDYMKQRSAEIPLGRPGRAEEFANLACFLVSEQGSYITGTAINVDGGLGRVV
jgi:NAD(P)-dependent dehydrogenase (short-subunit alcohol dehydrogenase family)